MENDSEPKKDSGWLLKTPWWVLFVPPLISFIIVTLIAVIFLTGN